VTANEARARAIIAREALIEHEVAHLTAAMLLGRGAREIRIVDVPEADANGIVRLAPLGDLTPERARVLGLITLVGGLATEEPYWPPRWPILPYVPIEAPTSEDERQLALVVEYLELDRSAYQALVVDAYWLIARSDFCQLAYAFSVALKERGALNGEQIDAIFEYMKEQPPTERNRTCCITGSRHRNTDDRGRDSCSAGRRLHPRPRR
jgi:hypothetical protein